MLISYLTERVFRGELTRRLGAIINPTNKVGRASSSDSGDYQGMETETIGKDYLLSQAKIAEIAYLLGLLNPCEFQFPYCFQGLL